MHQMHKQVCMSQVFQMRTAAAGQILKNRIASPDLLTTSGWEMSALRFIDLGFWGNKLPL